jgi:hypothetical protein
MAGLYVYLIKKGTITIDQVSNGWKAEVYALLIIDEYYTMDDVPAEWKDAVTAKLQELQS